MAKKVANPEKLKAEVALQKSKMQSLAILDKELSEKIQRLEFQRQSVREKYQKLKFATEQNVQKLNLLGN